MGGGDSIQPLTGGVVSCFKSKTSILGVFKHFHKGSLYALELTHLCKIMGPVIGRCEA